MSSPFQLLAEEEYSQNPNTGSKSPYSSPFAELANSEEYQESFGKNAFRTALQIPQGALEGTKGGIGAGLWHLLGQGEVNDPEELERIKAISEREGIPFDEEAYLEAGQRALGTIPTVSNIASKIEEKTGLPLEPKTRLQKGLRFGTMAAKAIPKSGSKYAPTGTTFRGMKTDLPRPVLGAGVEATKEVLQEIGVPEPFAELASFGVLKAAPTGAGKISFTKEKPSGMPERGFEKLKEPTDVPAKKIQQINDKLEKDFKTVSNEIIKDSPIGETAENLKNDPRFKRESKELLDQAQILANDTPGTLPSMDYKQALLQQSQKQIKGFALNEYKKNYLKFMKEAVENVLPENVTYGELVEQYRENNRSLGEYFEPGASKALNRAKKDVLLDQNRAIASVLEKNNPELSKVFKEGNERWSKIMDVEAIDNFVSDMFPEDKKIDFKHMKQIFDDPNYQRILKRSLGEEGAKSFELAIEDILTAERPYKMMREAQSKGFGDLVLSAKAYLVSPKLGYAKAAIDAARFSYRALFNATLDKPQLGLKFTKAVKELNAGDFKAAEQNFKAVEAEVLSKEEAAPKAKSEGETINAKAEKVETSKETKSKELKPLAEPKLIEYKPKPKEKQNLKERSDSIARESFNDALQGQKISTPEKKLLKDTEVALLQTRGKGQQFHGTREPIKELSENIYDKSSEQNIYGAGFYTSDALDIVDGYSKAKSAKNPTVYQVKEKTPQKIYDAEQSIKEFKDSWIERKKKHFEIEKKRTLEKKEKGEILYRTDKKYLGTFEDYIKNSENLLDEILFKENPKSVRDFYDKVRETGIDENMKAYEVQEYFDDIQSNLERMGYEGISHKGGLLTNNPEHHVKIYWKPENLEIQEFYYPKEFKKTNKITKEPFKKSIQESKRVETLNKFNEKKNVKPKKEKAEPKKTLTEEKVKEVKRQDISKKGLKEQKHYLLHHLENAIEKAPDIDITMPKKGKGLNSLQEAQHKSIKDYVIFDVPGDGQFKIKNHKKALQEFSDAVEKKWPDKPMRKKGI